MQTQVAEPSLDSKAQLKKVLSWLATVFAFFALIFLLIDWNLNGLLAFRSVFGLIASVLLALSLAAGAWARLKPDMTKSAKILSALTFALCVVWLVTLAVSLAYR